MSPRTLGADRRPLLLGLLVEMFHASPRIPRPALPVFRLALFYRSSEPVFGDPCPFCSPGISSLSQLLRDPAPGSQLSARITEATLWTPLTVLKCCLWMRMGPLLCARPAIVKESGKKGVSLDFMGITGSWWAGPEVQPPVTNPSLLSLCVSPGLLHFP